jgi:alpha-galactosidase
VAVTLFNEGDTAAVMSTTAAAAGLPAAPAYLLRDLWSKKLTVTAGAISVLVQPHQTVMYRISAPLSRR